MTVRDEQIAAIRRRKSRLRDDRLMECYAEITRAYEAASIIDQLADVIAEADRTPSDFRVLSNSESRRLSQFNDDSYHWDSYCRQLGRSIAHGEKAYILEELREIPSSGDAIVSESPQFDVILTAARQLIANGYDPDVLFAPIGLFVPFNMDTSLEVDWNSPGGELLMVPGGPRLRVHWSSGLTPLDRFVVLDSSKTRWRVKLDPSTNRRLTVAIGEPVAQPDAVMFLSQTVAKYEIPDPRAILPIAVEGETEADGPGGSRPAKAS